jgi:hypothetical protein
VSAHTVIDSELSTLNSASNALEKALFTALLMFEAESVFVAAAGGMGKRGEMALAAPRSSSLQMSLLCAGVMDAAGGLDRMVVVVEVVVGMTDVIEVTRVEEAVAVLGGCALRPG